MIRRGRKVRRVRSSTQLPLSDPLELSSSSPPPPRPSIVLSECFFDQDCMTLARALLGGTLVRVLGGAQTSGRIVEVECYPGGADAASHSHNGKKTPRNEPMYMKPGTAYVYAIYGMYYCCNISSRGDGSCVLLRALEPLEGQDLMRERRTAARRRRGTKADTAGATVDTAVPVTNAVIPDTDGKAGIKTLAMDTSLSGVTSGRRAIKKLKSHELCNGPSKLCTALAIDKSTCNKVDMSCSTALYVVAGAPVDDAAVVACGRVGIGGYGAEWAAKPYRLYDSRSPCVSVRDKTAEQSIYGVQ